MNAPLKTNAGTRRPYPFWAPRFWHSMLWSDWYRLMQRNGFRIHPLRWGLAGTVSSLALFNSGMARLCRRRFGAQIQAAALPKDPIFVLGHWRSGTTYLHELLSIDERFATPSTFQCFAANHFLVTQSWMPKLVWFVMPSKRPMDNMKSGWHAPQEDEFALCSLGAESPYLRIAFPNEPNCYRRYLDLQSLTMQELQAWQQRLEYFMKSLSLVDHRRWVMKSPTHTARVKVLSEMFPEAKFLHIVRQPTDVFASTINLWQVLDEAQGLQLPHHRDLPDYVLSCFEQMYEAFESQRAELPAGKIYDLRYEDLVRDPVETLRGAYEELELGEFQRIEPAVNEMVASRRDYQTNRYQLPEDVRDLVMSRWSEFAQRYGYSEA